MSIIRLWCAYLHTAWALSRCAVSRLCLDELGGTGHQQSQFYKRGCLHGVLQLLVRPAMHNRFKHAQYLQLGSEWVPASGSGGSWGFSGSALLVVAGADSQLQHAKTISIDEVGGHRCYSRGTHLITIRDTRGPGLIRCEALSCFARLTLCARYLVTHDGT